MFKVFENQSNLDQIISAVGASRDIPMHIDYFLIKKESMLRKNYNLKDIDGTTKSDIVNRDYHQNIEMLSGINLVKLAIIFAKKANIKTERTKHMLEKVRQSVDKGEIDLANLSEDMREAVEKVII